MTELQYYEQALKDYKKAYWKSSFSSKRDEIKLNFEVGSGFCNYFHRNHNIYMYSWTDFQKQFPILFSRRPYGPYYLNSYWFMPGKLRPRIKLLKQAIKLCKL